MQTEPNQTSAVRVDRPIWKLGRNVLLEISPSGHQVEVRQNYFNVREIRELADACMEAAAYLEANQT